MADASYTPKVYRKQGGSNLVIASSGSLTIESGGAITVEAGGKIVNAVEAAATTAATISAYGFTVVTGTTAGPTFLMSNPITGVMKYLSLTSASSAATNRALISCASTGTSFCTTGGNQITLATSALKGVTMIGASTSAWRIVGTYSGASVAAPRTT